MSSLDGTQQSGTPAGRNAFLHGRAGGVERMANNFSQAERMEKCARLRANWKRQTLSGAACRRSTWSWTAQSRIAERNRSRA